MSETPQPESPGDSTEPELDLHDPDEYHRRERLKEIHQRRQEVTAVLDDMESWTDEKSHYNQKSALARAVTAYIAELEPILIATEHEVNLPDNYPWDSPSHFADRMGGKGHTDSDHDMASYDESVLMYRALNQFLSKVKPLIEPDESDEWEV